MIENINILKEKTRQRIKGFSAYSDKIEDTISDLDNTKNALKIFFKEHLPSVLNGKTSSALHQLISTKIRKNAGIFFTGTSLSDKVVYKIKTLLTNGAKVIDPACGAGNLLIACAKHLPKGKNFGDTVRIWSNSIRGCDLHYEFIRAARLRLALLAASYHQSSISTNEILNYQNAFCGIQIGDYLEFSNIIKNSDCIVVNPPFGYTQAPKDCKWASGKVQTAGLFFCELLRVAENGHRLIGILPDVLRSGTRYEKWRDLILKDSQSLKIELFGKFDSKTDVDVFILDIVKGGKANKRKIFFTPRGFKSTIRNKVSNFFDVHVGPVVPHRDPEIGPQYPYINVSTITPWKTMRKITHFKKYKGKTFSPPFVVIHRTSSPNDKYRCKGAIINIKKKVAIENHLIVLTPHDKKLSTCKKLLILFQNQKTNDWFNQRICCRHLTVSSLSEMPWWELKNG